MRNMKLKAVPGTPSLIGLATALAIAATPAFAQDSAEAGSDTGIGEIVVTAQKRAENLLEVPISVSAFTSQALEARGATNLNSLLQSPPPGVTLQPFAGSNTLLVVDVRGVSNPTPGLGTVELGTAVYLDDVYLGRGQSLGTELADPERIEVLRGPQGTLFGRNAEGGAIRIVTKKPTGEFGGNVKGTYGNRGQRRIEAHLNLPAIAGFAIKLDYLNARRDGWTKNGPRLARLDHQKEFGEFNTEGYRASVRWQPMDTLTVDYSYDYMKGRDVRDYNVLVTPPFGFKPNGPLTPLATLGEVRAVSPSIHKRVKDSWIPMYNEGYREKAQGHTLQVAFNVNDDLTLKSITAYRKTFEDGSSQLGSAYVRQSLGPTGRPVSFLIPANGSTSLNLPAGTTTVYGISGLNSGNIVDQSQTSQEFQLIGSYDELEFVVGAYYFREKARDQRQNYFSLVYLDPALTNVFTTNAFTLGSATAGLSSQTAKSTSYAGFAQATWSPGFANDKLHLTAGIRYTSDKKTFLRTINAGAPSNIVGKPFNEKRWDPAFTIGYDIANSTNVYLRYAQAYRAGGVNVNSPTFKSFGAEVNKSWEAGLKSELLDRRLRIIAAVFENRIYNRQITVQVDPTNNPSLIDTINMPGATRIRGAELELTMAPINDLVISASYAYLKGKRPPSYRTLDPNADLRIQSLPRHAITAAIDWTALRTDIGDLLIHADYAMSSKNPGTSRVPFGAFAWDIERNVANARVSLQNIPVGPTKVRVSAFSKNLFNTAYPIFTAPGSVAILSQPRTVGVELGVDF